MSTRSALSWLRHFRERIDHVAIGFTVCFVLLLIVERALSLSVTYSAHVHHAIIAVECAIAGLVLVYWIISFTLRDPNRGWDRILADTQDVSIGNLLAGRLLVQLDKSHCRVRYARASDLDLLATMNYRAFKDTAYEATVEQFRRRNSSLIERNARSFLLFVDPIARKEIIGYSCILPFSELGMQLYLEGSVADPTFRAELAAATDEPLSSVLLFAVHLRPEFSLSKRGAARQYSLYFMSCVLLHFQDLCRRQLRAGQTVTIYAQTHESSMARRMTRMGFSETTHRSKDGYPIYSLRVN